MHDRLDGRQLVKTLVGDYKAGETPVPIPNTEVKLRLPMILLSGKVGNRRLHGPAKGDLGRATFVFGVGTFRG
ncbi:MAG: hypothetical protein RLZZ461_1239 [Planctomycetota bacterium]